MICYNSIYRLLFMLLFSIYVLTLGSCFESASSCPLTSGTRLTLMPSIRIKSSFYSALRDPNDNELVPPIHTELVPSIHTELVPPIHTQVSLPDLQLHNVESSDPTNSRSSPLSPTNLHVTTLRPRAYTASSRVHAHCTRNSLRNSRPGIPGEQVSRPNSRIEVVHVDDPPSRLSEGARTLEGLHADVIMDRSSGEPLGRIRSSISSLPRPGLEGQELRIVDVHHHDDIVEHLDVIDSQIGVVSSLTNAANSIIMCVSPCLSHSIFHA